MRGVRKGGRERKRKKEEGEGKEGDKREEEEVKARGERGREEEEKGGERERKREDGREVTACSCLFHSVLWGQTDRVALSLDFRVSKSQIVILQDV